MQFTQKYLVLEVIWNFQQFDMLYKFVQVSICTLCSAKIKRPEIF
jgi:hypothetical protein